MAKSVDFVLAGEPGTTRPTVERVLAERQFQLKWQDEQNGIATRGSQAANLAVGAAAQYFKVKVRLVNAQPGQSTLHLERENLGVGWARGGMLSPIRMNRNLDSLRADLENAFGAAGVLRGVSQK